MFINQWIVNVKTNACVTVLVAITKCLTRNMLGRKICLVCSSRGRRVAAGEVTVTLHPQSGGSEKLMLALGSLLLVSLRDYNP